MNSYLNNLLHQISKSPKIIEYEMRFVKSVIIIVIAFVLLVPLAVFAQLIPEPTPELTPEPTPEPTPELAEPESSLSFQSVECPPGSFEKLFSGEVIVCINEATGKALKPGELTGEQQGTYVTAGIIIAIIAASIGFVILKKKSSSN